MPLAEVSNSVSQQASGSTAPLLVCLPSLGADGFQTLRQRLAAALPGQTILIASPDAPTGSQDGESTVLNYPVTNGPDTTWTLGAKDYIGAAQLAVEHRAAATLILGPEASSLSDFGLLGLADAVLAGKADLAVPRYKTGPHDALVSSAMLYPLTFALFGSSVHLPLPLDVAFSARMAQRFAIRKPESTGQAAQFLWPIAEAAMSSFSIREIEAGERTLPQPSDSDLNSLLAQIVGALFADIETKASFWQRARPASAVKPNESVSYSPAETQTLEDVQSMAESFRNAYANLQEIWSLVLPPQSLLGLKKLSKMPADAFEMPADLWARTVYDFVLAFHARTINRGHLLGALTPLYLAWVASHLRLSGDDSGRSASHVEETAAAFAAEKPYIVSRWRWPDRFNP
jgi:hypothetical protein